MTQSGHLEFWIAAAQNDLQAHFSYARYML